MTAYATKTSLTKCLRFKGYDIPSSRDAYLHRHQSKFWYSFNWRDSSGQCHFAEYTVWDGRPALCVDNDQVPITTEEAERYGLIRQ